MPFNIVAGTLFFFCWYWTVGFPSGELSLEFPSSAMASTARPSEMRDWLRYSRLRTDHHFYYTTDTNRAGYAYLMYMLFQLYFATFAQFVSAFSPNAMAASIVSLSSRVIHREISVVVYMTTGNLLSLSAWVKC